MFNFARLFQEPKLVLLERGLSVFFLVYFWKVLATAFKLFRTLESSDFQCLGLGQEVCNPANSSVRRPLPLKKEKERKKNALQTREPKIHRCLFRSLESFPSPRNLPAAKDKPIWQRVTLALGTVHVTPGAAPLSACSARPRGSCRCPRQPPTTPQWQRTGQLRPRKTREKERYIFLKSRFCW